MNKAPADSSRVATWTYDVFLCFRGIDVRNKFISHLHRELERNNIKTFFDGMLNRGITIRLSLHQAIETSRIAIIVFSPNFASSTWCLDELVKILECKDERGQLVLPVFYDVEPKDIRKQTGTFADALAVWEEYFGNDDAEKVTRWRSVLTKAANLTGWCTHNYGSEASLLDLIVKKVSREIRGPRFQLPVHSVGLQAHIQAIKLKLDKFHMVAICGQSGIGKTVIAKALYNEIADEFDGCSFLVDVRETSRQYGLTKLQEDLLQDIIGDKSIKVDNVRSGIKLILDKLEDKKILLILDDVDRLEHIKNLTGDSGEWFNLRSKIIITTQLEMLAAEISAEIYPVNKGLNENDAHQLFCSTASPPIGFEHMASSFTTFANGHPLALTLLGSFLKANKTRQEWESAFQSLKKMASQGAVDAILRLTFEKLDLNTKAIFLDIACFFNGEERSHFTQVLHRCNFYPESGLDTLAERSIVYIESNKIWMHNLIQEFGREIVHQESPKDPGRRSRLWYHKDIKLVLKEETGTNAVEGIKLDMLEPEEIFTRRTALKKMKGLRLIIGRDLYISGSPENVSEELKWLDFGSEYVSKRWPDRWKDDKPNDIPKASYSKPIQFPRAAYWIYPRMIESLRTRNPSVVLPGILILALAGAVLLVKDIIQPGHINIEKLPNRDGRFEDKKGIKKFSLEELDRSSDYFSQNKKIGLGGFGHVYRAGLEDGREVAIKRARRETETSATQDKEFESEIEILGKMKHKHLVSLVGFVEEGEEKMLVYEYMHNGSLDKHLHCGSVSMSWITRLRLALEVALGIQHLHCGTTVCVLHGDINPSNILLDSDWTAKISDFGSSKFEIDNDATSDISLPGTVGYLDPEFYSTGRLTTESDVFAFGVVLLELLSGRRAFYWDEHGRTRHVVEALVPFITQGAITSVLDKRIIEPPPAEMEAVMEMGSLAAECVDLERQKRPTMTEVVGCLTGALNLCLPDDKLIYI